MSPKFLFYYLPNYIHYSHWKLINDNYGFHTNKEDITF